MDTDTEILNLRKDLDKLSEHKQNKLSLGGMISLFVLLIAVIGSMVSVFSLAISQGTADRYRASQAAADFKMRDYQIQALQERVKNLEVEVEHLNNTIHEFDQH